MRKKHEHTGKLRVRKDEPSFSALRGTGLDAGLLGNQRESKHYVDGRKTDLKGRMMFHI